MLFDIWIDGARSNTIIWYVLNIEINIVTGQGKNEKLFLVEFLWYACVFFG